MRKREKIDLKKGLSSFFMGKCNKKQDGKTVFSNVFLSN